MKLTTMSRLPEHVALTLVRAGKITPATHKQDQCHNPRAVRNNHWEMSPSLQVAQKAGHHPCQTRFPGVKQLTASC